MWIRGHPAWPTLRTSCCKRSAAMLVGDMYPLPTSPGTCVPFPFGPDGRPYSHLPHKHDDCRRHLRRKGAWRIHIPHERASRMTRPLPDRGRLAPRLPRTAQCDAGKGYVSPTHLSGDMCPLPVRTRWSPVLAPPLRAPGLSETSPTKRNVGDTYPPRARARARPVR